MHKKSFTTSSLLNAGFIFAIGLFSIVGCSPNTASDSSEMAMGNQAAGTQKFLTSAQPNSLNASSLEAHQQGALGDNPGPLPDVHFAFDRYDLSPNARDILHRVHATWLKTHPQISIEVEGHGDDRGTSEYNVALGAKRAENVKRYLMDVGIPGSRLSTISYGEEIPVCKEHSETCWAKNRRAHFAVRSAPSN